MNVVPSSEPHLDECAEEHEITYAACGVCGDVEDGSGGADGAEDEEDDLDEHQAECEEGEAGECAALVFLPVGVVVEGDEGEIGEAGEVEDMDVGAGDVAEEECEDEEEGDLFLVGDFHRAEEEDEVAAEDEEDVEDASEAEEVFDGVEGDVHLAGCAGGDGDEGRNSSQEACEEAGADAGEGDAEILVFGFFGECV